MLSDIEIAHRKPVWTALSDLWLDTEMDDGWLSRIARVMHESSYAVGELRHIYLCEVAPVVYRNLLIPAGEWAGFDEAGLHSEILESLQERNRKFRQRRNFLRRWFIRHQRKLMIYAMRVPRFCRQYRFRQKRRLMTYATEEHWVVLVAKVEALCNDTGAADRAG